MRLTELMQSENINIETLEKGMKHIGLSLSKFDQIEGEQIPSLIELFKKAIEIDPKKSTRFEKLDLRTKLDRCLKGEVLLNINSAIPERKEEPEKKNIESQLKDIKRKFPKKQNTSPLKLGAVKFYDSSKGFGYVNSFDDQKDCFIHSSTK